MNDESEEKLEYRLKPKRQTGQNEMETAHKKTDIRKERKIVLQQVKIKRSMKQEKQKRKSLNKTIITSFKCCLLHLQVQLYKAIYISKATRLLLDKVLWQQNG